MSAKPIARVSIAEVLDHDIKTLQSAAPATTLPITALQSMPHQVRRYFNPEELKALAQNISENGLIQPIVVRKISQDRFEVIAGERRLRAAHLAGLQTVRVSILDVTRERAIKLNLIENLERSDINPYETAIGVFAVLKLELRVEDSELERLLKVAFAQNRKSKAEPVSGSDTPAVKLINRFFASSQRWTLASYINHLLPLRSAPEDIKILLERGQLEYTKAALLVKIDNQAMRENLSERCQNGLSIRDLQGIISALNAQAQTPSKVEAQLVHVAHRSKLTVKAKGRSTLLLEFRDAAQLNAALQRLGATLELD